MALTPQTAVEELAGQSSLHGLDLDEPEALRLLNEADTDMCVRSEWTTEIVTYGTTVADQSDYPLTNINAVRTVLVGGVPYRPHEGDSIAELRTGDLYLGRGTHGVYGVDGETLVLFPTPEAAGVAITGEAVVYPDEFAIDGDFNVPKDFRRGLLNYVRYVSLGSSEDDSARQEYISEYEAEVERLRRHRITRRGHGRARMRIRGVTA